MVLTIVLEDECAKQLKQNKNGLLRDSYTDKSEMGVSCTNDAITARGQICCLPFTLEAI